MRKREPRRERGGCSLRKRTGKGATRGTKDRFGDLSAQALIEAQENEAAAASLPAVLAAPGAAPTARPSAILHRCRRIRPAVVQPAGRRFEDAGQEAEP